MKPGIKTSLYTTVRSDQPNEVDLMEVLVKMQREMYKERNDRLRLLYKNNLDEYKKQKSNLPAFTPSGTFSGKSADTLTSYSGYICIDIDGQDNSHITDYAILRNELSKIKNIDYCSLSASGEGVFCLVKVGDAIENHKKYFNALMLCFKSLGINVDTKCDNINRLRFVSYDTDYYLDESDPEPFTQILEQKPTDKKEQSFTPSTTNTYKPSGKNNRNTLTRAEEIIAKIEDQALDITGDYGDWISLGMALAHEFSDAGLEMFHSISRFHPKYKEHEVTNVFNGLLKSSQPDNPITIGTFFHIAKENGL